MKSLIVLFLLASAAVAGAQSQARAIKAADDARFKAMEAELAKAQREAKLAQGSPYRYVTNQLFDITKSKLWKDLALRVQTVNSNGVIGRCFSYREIGAGVHDYNVKDWGGYVLILHAGHTVASGEEATYRVIHLGMTNLDGVALRVFDCGTTNRPAPNP